MGVSVAASGYQPGDIKQVAHNVIDPGFLACDGSQVSRTGYAALFNKIGTTWGVGDGATTFNVPNLLGRTPVGAGTGSGLTARTVGQVGGEEAHVLSNGEMTSHSHGFTAAAGSVFYGTSSGTQSVGGTPAGSTTGAQGGGGSHNNMQPYAVVLWQIKY